MGHAASLHMATLRPLEARTERNLSNMMSRVLLAALAITAALAAKAQEATHLCHTSEIRQELLKQYPWIAEIEAASEAEIRELMLNNATLRDGEVIITIPIVFHILHQGGAENISNEQILDQMVVLNRDFRKLNPDISQVIPAFQGIAADCRIEFALPTKDPYGNCHNGIDRIRTVQTFLGENSSKANQWPRNRYLNVWISRILIGGAAGYAYLPAGTEGFLQIFDGIMMLQNYTGSIGTSSVGNSRTLTHEVGHYLNLQHVWGDNNTPGQVCGDDGVEDTPITKGFGGCPNPEASKVCDPDIYENYQNYMDYSYCSRMFTEGQAERMRATLFATTAQRNNLWTEQNLILTGVAEGHQATCPPEADFYALVGSSLTNPSVPYNALSCTGAQVRFMDNSHKAFATSWNWTFEGGTPATSTERNPTVTYDSPGWKKVTLVVGNAHGTTTKVDETAILISNAGDGWQVPYMESFEVSNTLHPYLAYNHDLNHTKWDRFSGAGHSGSACARLNSGDRNPFNIINPGNHRDYDEMVSPPLNLSGLGAGVLSFHYSYSSMAADLANVTESLEVFSSTDCGRTWQSRATLTNQNLITNGNSMGPGQWGFRSINLPGSLLTSNVRFKFRFISSEFSNHLYIDDIYIGGPVGVEELEQGNGLALFPNPTNDHFTLWAPGMRDQATMVTITDLRGAVVHQAMHAPQGGMGIEFNARSLGLSEGLYLLRAANAVTDRTVKLVVGR